MEDAVHPAFAGKFSVTSKLVVDYLHYLEVMDLKGRKGIEEMARESRESKRKPYEDYPWANLCEDVTKMKKLRVPELDKYLKRGVNRLTDQRILTVFSPGFRIQSKILTDLRITACNAAVLGPEFGFCL